MKFNINHKVVIWANDNYNVLGMLRQLVPYGINVFVLFNKTTKFCAVKSKYCKSYHVAKNIDDGINYLLNYFKNENNKTILLTASDLLAEAIDQNRHELSKYFYLTGTTESGLLTKVLDKNFMSSLAIKHGFTVPKTMVCKRDSDISDVQYPCILKPNKQVSGIANFKFKKCNNKSELEQVLNTASKQSVFTLQQYIEKENDLLIFGARLYDGTWLFPGAFIKDRWSPNDGTHGYLTKDIPESANLDSIKSFLEDIDYYGTFSFEYGIHNNKSYFFECNLRNDGTSNHFNQAGANLNLAFVLSIANIDFNDIYKPIPKLTYFIDEIADRNNIKNGNITRKKYCKDKKEATAFMYYDKDDIIPYRYMLLKYYIKPLINIYKRIIFKK